MNEASAMVPRFRGMRFLAQDGREIYYRDYDEGRDGDLNPAGNNLVPILCLAGLNRNSADFHDLACRLAPSRRLLAMDYRGRGLSEWDPNPQNYRPATYISDIQQLLALTGCHEVIVLGTSLGGILAMGLAVAMPSAVRGVILNDIGPELDPIGTDRIKNYIDEIEEPANFAAAAAIVRRKYHKAYPDWDAADWLEEVRRSYVAGEDGGLRRNYDPAIARAMAAQKNHSSELWRIYGALRHIPTLSLRGALSDMLSSATVARMVAEKPDLASVTVPNRGHTPCLDEPECVAAIDEFLARIDDSN